MARPRRRAPRRDDVRRWARTCRRSSTAAATTSAPTPTAPPRRATTGATTLNTSASRPPDGASPVTPGTTFDGTFDVDEPGGLGLRPRRVRSTVTRRGQPGLRHGTLGNGTASMTLRERRTRSTATSATRSAGPASSTGARRSWTSRSAPAARHVRVSTRSTGPGRSRTSGSCSTRCCTRGAPTRRRRRRAPAASVRGRAADRPRQAEAVAALGRRRPSCRPRRCRARASRSPSDRPRRPHHGQAPRTSAAQAQGPPSRWPS